MFLDPNSSMYPDSPLGLPSDPMSSYPPAGFETTVGAAQPEPHISTLQSVWNEIKQDSNSAISSVESGVKTVYGGIKDVTKTVYGDVANAAGTVADDVTKPIRTTYTYAVVGVIILFAGFYFLGKSGVLKVNAVV